MLYLLDANVLIDANRDYYPIDRVPEFWDWLAHVGAEKLVKIPVEIFEEIKEGNDELARWGKRKEVEEALLLDEQAQATRVSYATEHGYANDLTDDEIEKLGRDPFLIGYALVDPNNRTIVTTEASKPNKQRGNRHLPDVCNELGVRSCNTFQFVRELNFSTNWRTNITDSSLS